MNQAIYNLIMLAVMIIAAIVSSYLVPILKSRIGTETYGMVSSVVQDAVLMAQQVMAEQPGKERKDFVMNWAAARLLEYGIDVDTEQLSVMVEAAVKRMKLAGGSV